MLHDIAPCCMWVRGITQGIRRFSFKVFCLRYDIIMFQSYLKVNMENEIWKPVSKISDELIDLSKYYEVSSLGNLRHISGKVKLSCKNDNGYKVVQLKAGKWIRNFKVHRLVADAFIDNPLNNPVVNHIDCDKSNNNFTNLEWVTYKENTMHAIANGIYSNSRKTKLNPLQVAEIRKIHSINRQYIPLAKEYNVSPETIKAIVRGLIWKNV